MKQFLVLVFCFLSILSFGQDKNPNEVFYEYEEINVNTETLFQSAKSISRNPIPFFIGKWEMDLHNSEIISPNYKSVDQDGNELSKIGDRPIPMRGFTKEGGEVSITIGKGFLFGFVKEGKETYYIEPSRYYTNTRNEDQFLIYNTKNIKETSIKTCGYKDVNKKLSEKNEDIGLRAGLCFDIKYAICNDWSIINQYGVAGAEARAIGITNDINANYDNEFSDELRFVISGQYNSTCSSCDPSQWTSTTDPFVLLPNFSNWAKNNLASSPISIAHDVASLWSGRDFNGSTVGLAYVGEVCDINYKYNVLQDINDSGYQLRVLTAHELGHNLDAGHDAGSGNIMASSLNNTSTWSTGSINGINNYIASPSATCLETCSDTPATAYFNNGIGNVSENSSGGTAGPCSEPYIEYQVSVNLTKQPTANLLIGISVDNESTATPGYDYDLLTSTLTFTPSGTLSQDINVRIYDDKIEELDETVVFSINIISGPGNISSSNEFVLTIESNNDEISATCCAGADYFFGESANYYMISGIFHGDYEDSKTRVLLSAAELTSYGLTAGPLYGLDVYVQEKNSTGTYNNFSIGYKLIGNSSLNGVAWQSTTQIFSQDVTTTALAWNSFTFDSPIVWDGTSSIYLDFCFDNSSIIGRDRILSYLPGTTSSEFISYARTNNSNGCTMNIGSYTYYNNYTPIMLLRSSGGAVVETAALSNSEGRIRQGETAHLYSEDNEIIASIKNLGSTDMECINVSLTSGGSGKSLLNFGTFEHTDKTFQINADNSSVYELTLYFTQNELAVWGTEKLALNVLKSSVPITNAASTNSQFIFSKSAVENIGSGNNIAYKAVVNGPAYFALTNGYKCDVMGTFENSDMIVHELGMGVLMKNMSGVQYLVKVNSSGTMTSTIDNSAIASSYLSKGDLCINEYTKTICVLRSPGAFTEFNVDNSGNIITNNIASAGPNVVNIDSGNFGLMENGAGIVFKNAQNECWKMYMDEGGTLSTSEVPCE